MRFIAILTVLLFSLGTAPAALADNTETAGKIAEILDFEAKYEERVDGLIAETASLPNFWSGSENADTAEHRQALMRKTLIARKDEVLDAIVQRMALLHERDELDDYLRKLEDDEAIAEDDPVAYSVNFAFSDVIFNAMMGSVTEVYAEAEQEKSRMFCNEMPEALRADCIAAFELLTAEPAQEKADLTVMATASAQGIRFEYGDRGEECVAQSLVLPEQTTVRLLVTADDGIYELSVPDREIEITGLPGRVNEMMLDTKETGFHMATVTPHGDAAIPVAFRIADTGEYLRWVMRTLPAGC